MENLKYKILEDNYILYLGKKLYKIQALKDFSNVKKGDIGGYVESYDNLSQEGNCWIYDDAKVYEDAQIYEYAQIYGSAEVYGSTKVSGNAYVYGSAFVYGSAIVHGNAKVYEDARIYGSAKVYGYAQIYEDVKIYENAQIYGYAQIYEYARIYGSAEVYGNACVYGGAKIYGGAYVYGSACVYDGAYIYEDARIYGNARVYGNACVYGGAEVYGSARVSEQQHIQSGVVQTDLSKDLKESIRSQTGLGVFNNKVIAYKQVNKDLTSFYDDKFKYKVGKVIEVENADITNKSCSSGLHFSNMNYWNKNKDILSSTFLMAEIDIKDVITVQEGKIRCKKAKILGSYDIKE